MWSHTTKNSSHWNGAYTTEDANTDQKLCYTLSCNEKYQDKKKKVCGQTFPLAEVSRLPRVLQVLLATDQTKLIWLMEKAPSSVPSQIQEGKSVYTKVSTGTFTQCKSTNGKAICARFTRIFGKIPNLGKSWADHKYQSHGEGVL